MKGIKECESETKGEEPIETEGRDQSKGDEGGG